MEATLLARDTVTTTRYAGRTTEQAFTVQDLYDLVKAIREGAEQGKSVGISFVTDDGPHPYVRIVVP